MTKKIDWVAILEKNEEAILKAGKEAYTNACTTSYDNSFSNTMDVVIDADGDIRMHEQQQNSTSMDVWKGEAICVISFKKFNPWESFEEDEEIKKMLEPEELEEFMAWLKESEITSWGRNELRDWNSGVAGRLDREMEEWDIDEYAENQAQDKFDEAVKHQKAYAEFSE